MKSERRHAWKVLVLPFLFMSGCSHEEHFVSEQSVVVGTSEPRLAGMHKVFLDGKQVGWVQTWRMEGDAGRRDVKRVVNMDKSALGWMDDSGRAYRYNPHGGEDLVGTTRDERGRVRAILGMPEGRVELVDIAR